MAATASTVNPLVAQLNTDAKKHLGHIVLAGAGAGVGARGLVGLYNLLKRNLAPPKPILTGPAIIDVPFPAKVEEEEKLAAAPPSGSRGQNPFAVGTSDFHNTGRGTPDRGGRVPARPQKSSAAAPPAPEAPTNSFFADPTTDLTPLHGSTYQAQPRQAAYPSVNGAHNMYGPRPAPQLNPAIPQLAKAGEQEKLAGFIDKLLDSTPTSEYSIPWVLPAHVAGGLGGAYTGWKLMDHILDKRRKSELDEQVDSAKNEFQQAILSQHERPRSARFKIGTENSLGAALDELAGKFFQKLATTGGDVVGKSLGTYGTYAGLSALLAGSLAYGAAKKRQNRTLLERAQKEQLRRESEKHPIQVMARPVPQPASPAVSLPVSEEG